MNSTRDTTNPRPAWADRRQTVDRIRHPRFGDCTAVYGNGPGSLVLADGSILDAKVSTGVWSGSVLHMRVTVRGVTEEAEILAAGESHKRVWSPRFGPGWLVTEPAPDYLLRFEPDEGAVVRFRFIALTVGRGIELAPPTTPAPPRLDPEEEDRWTCYETAEGELLSFRGGGQPPSQIRHPKKEEASPPAEVAQRDLFPPAVATKATP